MDPMGAPVNDDCSDLAALDAGDREAGGRLYDRHAAVIFALCREETGSRSVQDAEDAVQETFLRAFRMRERLTDCTGFRPWLYAIARLVCKERRTARARERRDIDYGLDAARTTSMAGARSGAHAGTNEGRRPMPTHTMQARLEQQGGPAPSAPLERRETLARLGTAIDALPPDVRLALHIFYIEPDPVDAAKRALGISRAQFYRLVAEARQLISAQLTREDLAR